MRAVAERAPARLAAAAQRDGLVRGLDRGSVLVEQAERASHQQRAVAIRRDRHFVVHVVVRTRRVRACSTTRSDGGRPEQQPHLSASLPGPRGAGGQAGSARARRGRGACRVRAAVRPCAVRDGGLPGGQGQAVRPARLRLRPRRDPGRGRALRPRAAHPGARAPARPGPGAGRAEPRHEARGHAVAHRAAVLRGARAALRLLPLHALRPAPAAQAGGIPGARDRVARGLLRHARLPGADGQPAAAPHAGGLRRRAARRRAGRDGEARPAHERVRRRPAPGARSQVPRRGARDAEELPRDRAQAAPQGAASRGRAGAAGAAEPAPPSAEPR